MRPNEFAAQLNMSLMNGWGIVRTIVDLCLKHPDGKYVLIKDPNKVIHLPASSTSRLLKPCSLSFACMQYLQMPSPRKKMEKMMAGAPPDLKLA